MADHTNILLQGEAVVRMLMKTTEPLTAEVIGRRLRLHGSIETRRRRVREIVKYLRVECGEWIVGLNPAGYWMTDDEQMWLDYCEKRQIDGKRVIGEAARRQRMVTDNRGQGLLFVR